MAETRWLLDGMLGRLARYLRFMGHDVEYDRTAADDDLLRRSRADGRVLVTRDRLLAARAPGSVLLSSPYLPDQLRALRAVHPEVEGPVRFDRCSRCNAPLLARPPEGGAPSPPHPMPAPAGREVFVCPNCGQLYWEGSHTDRIRRRLAEIFAGGP